MDIVSQERNYIPIDLETRFHACKRKTESHWKTSKVCSFYHVKRSSLFRWLKQFDGTVDSLKEQVLLIFHPDSLTLEQAWNLVNKSMGI